MKKVLCALAVLALAGSALAKKAEKPAGITMTSTSPHAVAAFKKGRLLLTVARRADAIIELKKVVALDPDFALANAMLGAISPGPDADALLDKALAGAAKLPDVERLEIELLAAEHEGDVTKTDTLRQQVADAAPGDWQAQIAVAVSAMNRRNADEAIERPKKAVAADPDAAPADNTLAYSYAQQRKWDEAIAAAKKQIALLPKEPNPQESLGEALLWAGHFPDSEAAFLKALKIAPTFAGAWQGVALARYFRGDWTGGDEALAKGKQAASLPADKYDFDQDLAWPKLAQGKLADAMAIINAAEKQPDLQQLPAYADAPLARARLDYDAEKYNDAIGEAATAMERAANGEFAGAARNAIRRGALVVQALSQIKLGKLADAESAAAAAVVDETAKLPASAEFQNIAYWVKGSLAAAEGDAKTAADAYQDCLSASTIPCLYERWAALDKPGDKAGADAARKEILAQHYRDPGDLVIHTRLGK